jgi:diacylglycerol kinase family enzyme/membrane-associated phospholipid phosphatase
VASNADTERLRLALDQHFGAGGYRLVETSRGDGFAARVDGALIRAARRGCDLVVAAGGDGTVSVLADSLHRLDGEAARMALAIVPCGTANILARELEIPTSIEDAVALAAARPRLLPLDGIVLGDRLCLTQVGIGLDGFMIRDTSREARQRFGRLSYLMTLARRAAGHRSRSFTLRVDDRVLRVRAWEVLIANASTLGAKPFVWGPEIDPADGHLDLCIFQVQHWRDLAHLLWLVLTGRHEDCPNAIFVPIRKHVHVGSNRPLPVQGDGELLGHTPVRLNVAAAAIDVVVPAASDATEAEPSVKGTSHAGANGKPPADGTAAASRWARARKSVGALDTSTYLAINRLHGGPWVDRPLAFSSRILDWGEAWVVVAVLAALSDPANLGHLPIAVLPPLWLAMLTVNFPIKRRFLRQRPFLVHERCRLVGRRPKDSSFPSGHTAAAFAGATLLSMHLPGFAPPFYAYALLVGFSRVYLGVHFPADVLAGGFVGTALALAYAWIWALVVPGA